jgi:Uma2 family endonuclease
MATPLHRSLMTLEEFVALPEDNSARYELQEGILVVSPRSTRPNQLAAQRLSNQLDAQLPDEWESVLDFEVIVRPAEPAILRVPDVVVTPVDGPMKRLEAADVLLAVEIVFPGSRNVDLHLKPFEYAEAGIPHYWVVDLDPPAPSVTVYGLGAPGDGYAESQTATSELVVQEPFAMRIDIEALVARRGRRD